MIGDSSNGLSTKNTLNTLSSLDGVARGANKPLSVIYVNNHLLVKEDGGMQKAEKEANTVLNNILTTVSLFLSGENEALDNQDMFGIIDQSHYSTIGVEPGIYGLSVHSKQIKLPDGAIPTVGRTLTLEGMSFDTNLTLLHHKRGFVTDPNAITIAKESNFPIHMISCANFLSVEEKTLNKINEDYDNIMANIKANSISGTNKSNVDEATGLVF